ncbi:peptidase M23 [Streptomyces erythrochromogenes]|uniref:peptidase M23 n=1 Tax=Streptomyces erythrochromogenes TaxID=285574 RepID=UPI0034373F8B
MNDREMTQAALRAAAMATKGARIKYLAIAAVLLLVGSLFLSMLSGGPASARTCTDSGPGTGDSSPAEDNGGDGGKPVQGSAHQKQLAHVKTIDSVAVRLKLPGRATLIALMTAMQESTLENLDHGDRDSLGLFQQRPSMDWGTREQIMDPSYSAESFFLGRGTNPGLTDISNWASMPLGDAAQKVQRSAYPKLYANHERLMRKFAAEAGIDLERAGETGGTSGSQGTDPSSSPPPSSGSCADKPKPGSGGGTFTDGKESWTLNNPRSVPDAIAWAKLNAGPNSEKKWERRCLAYTAIVYGWNVSGVSYAIDHYTVVPAAMRHDKDRNPPPGALMYWTTGSRAGHIAVYLGDGMVASNDILRPGYIDVVPAELIESKWGAGYVGWTPPYFPHAG